MEKDRDPAEQAGSSPSRRPEAEAEADDCGEAGNAGAVQQKTPASTGHRHDQAAQAAEGALADELFALLFGVRRSVRYHMRRQLFFDRVSTTSAAVAVAFASGTVLVRVAQPDSIWVLVAATVSAVTQALLLTLQPSQKARKHNDLARDFISLETQIATRQACLTTTILGEFMAKRLMIEAGEPPVARILDVICHNDLLMAYGQDDEKKPISWLQRLTANLRSEYNEPRPRTPKHA